MSLIIAIGSALYVSETCMECLFVRKVSYISLIVFICVVIVSIVIEVVRYFIKECYKAEDSVQLLSDYDGIQMISQTQYVIPSQIV